MTAARVTLVTNTLLNPGTGAPVVGHDVSIRLNTVGFISGGTAEKVKTRTVTTDDTGTWTVALEVNADVDPAGTYYTVQEFAGLIWTFVVPYSATPLTLRSCLVDAPTNSDPLTAGVPLPSSTVPSGYVWTTDGAGSGDYAAESGGGAVTSVNGHVGTVVLAATDVGADASGAAAAAQAAAIAASQPLDSDLTAIAALTTTTYGRALLALADAAAGRTALALGSAATQASTAFDAAGAAAAAQAAAIAASQPLDSDLTAIAALTTTSYGRSYLALADAAAGRTLLALGTAAVAATGDFDAAGAAAAAQAASQPLDSDLTAIAALTTTSFGRSFNALADAAAGRTLLALGTAATSNTTAFDTAGAAAAAQAASQPLDSDLTAIAALVTTSFGRSFLALADAAAGRTLLALGTLATQSGTFSGTSSGTNTGDQTITLTGDVTGSGTGSFAATLASVASAGTTGDASHTLTVTIDVKGRVTSVTSNAIAIAESAVTNLTTDLAAKAPLASPALTGSPSAPTQATGDNSTKLATTAYADASGASTDLFGANTSRLTRVPQLFTHQAGLQNYTTARQYCVPFLVTTTTTLTKLAFTLQTNGSAGSVVRLGIYADSNGYPGALLVDAGTVTAASGAGGLIALTLGSALILPPGTYWLVACSQGAPATAPQGVTCSTIAPMVNTGFGTVGCFYKDSITGAFANPFGAGGSVLDGTSADNIPVLGFGA